MGGFKESLPRKKDWKPGQTQLGLFMRTPSGAWIYFTANSATLPEIEAATKLLKEMSEATARSNTGDRSITQIGNTWDE